jgi:DNA polymerase alpha subunit B
MLASRVDKLRNYADRKSLELTVACGPFTASDGLFYKTLDALIEVLTEEPPDILMLIGPFVDLKHPVIQSCSVEKSFEEV